MTEKFYVVIELARVGRISIAIEDFYVTIEMATIENPAAHDRAGCAKASTHDSVALCCVVTEEARRARQAMSRAHDRPWVRTTSIGNKEL